MIDLDTSVALSHRLAEDRCPPREFWAEPMVSSRLLQFELWTRVHARQLADSHGEAVRALLARVALLELVPDVLARALEPFPVPVRTLGALHLASATFLAATGQPLEVATYDERMARAARALGLAVSAL